MTDQPGEGPVEFQPDINEIKARAEQMLERKTKEQAAYVDPEAADDFARRAAEVHDQVKGILDGTVDFEEIERAEREREQMAKAKEEIRRREARERQLKGRPGKGHKGKYELLCTRCFTEYWVTDIDKCTHCGNTNLIT
jgi:hypothetical protein